MLPAETKGKKGIAMKKIMLFAVVAMCMFGMCGCGNESVLEESAVPVVTEIIQEQLGAETSCVAVNITEQVSDKHYKAKATLSNGNDIVIMIEDRGDQIYVTIPTDQ